MNLDVIKAMRRGGCEAEMELWFPLFQSSAQIKDDIYSQTEAGKFSIEVQKSEGVSGLIIYT